jgi:hypothetical protein
LDDGRAAKIKFGFFEPTADIGNVQTLAAHSTRDRCRAHLMAYAKQMLDIKENARCDL